MLNLETSLGGRLSRPHHLKDSLPDTLTRQNLLKLAEHIIVAIENFLYSEESDQTLLQFGCVNINFGSSVFATKKLSLENGM